MIDEINYDNLIKKALKNVVKDALKFTQKNGLNGNHFYITFRTDAKGVVLPPNLKQQYPKSMTIVLQHQFANLKVDNDAFSVDLKFAGVPHNLKISFASITYFSDPYAKFVLSFENGYNDDEKNANEASQAEVISIDNLRKKQC